MTVSPEIYSQIALIARSLSAIRPIQTASKLTVAAIKKAGALLVTQIETNLEAAGTVLDEGDPTGYPGSFAAYLQSLRDASADQDVLSNMRGLVGRAMFNLGKGSV